MGVACSDILRRLSRSFHSGIDWERRQVFPVPKSFRASIVGTVGIVGIVGVGRCSESAALILAVELFNVKLLLE